MAKTPKIKKKAISVHSRAARRAGSPSVNIGTIPTSKTTTEQRSTSYSSHHAAGAGAGAGAGTPQGIRKRKTALSRNQKLRRKRGVERADATSAKIEIKKEKSMDKLKKVKDRAKDWEDVNGKGKRKAPLSNNPFGALGGMDLDGEDNGIAPGAQAPAVKPIETPTVHHSNGIDEEQEMADDDI